MGHAQRQRGDLMFYMVRFFSKTLLSAWLSAVFSSTGTTKTNNLLHFDFEAQDRRKKNPYICIITYFDTTLHYMKFISWNVNGLRACREKGFEESSLDSMLTAFACKKRSCRKDKSTSNLKGTRVIGLRRKERLFRNRYFYAHPPFECNLRLGN